MSLDIQEALAKGRTVYVPNGDGTLTFTNPSGESWTVGNSVKEAVAWQAETTRGNALIAELRARRGNLIEPVEFDGQTWYLLKMNGSQVREVGIRVALMRSASETVSAYDEITLYMKATLQVGLVKGERDPERFFNPEPYQMEDAYGRIVNTTECEQFIDEPGTDDVCAFLFEMLCQKNPGAFPQKKKYMELGAALMGLTLESSSPGPTNAESAPDSSPTDSESSSNTEGETPPLSN